MGGGGGQSGAVEYPAYMEALHEDYLFNGGASLPSMDVTQIANTMWAGTNPWTTLISTGFPDVPAFLDPAQGGILDTDIDAVIADMLTDKNAIAGDVDTDIDAAITVYKNYIDAIHTVAGVEAELANFDAGMVNINAVHSSAFAIGHQLVASQVTDAKLRGYQAYVQMYIEKAKLKRQLELDFSAKYHGIRGELKLKVFQSRLELARIQFVAYQEHAQMRFDLVAKREWFDMDIAKRSIECIGAIAGTAVPTSDSPSKMGSALSGATAGAATGAMAGMMIPAVGPAMGAIVGGSLGLAAGLA